MIPVHALSANDLTHLYCTILGVLPHVPIWCLIGSYLLLLTFYHYPLLICLDWLLSVWASCIMCLCLALSCVTTACMVPPFHRCGTYHAAYSEPFCLFISLLIVLDLAHCLSQCLHLGVLVKLHLLQLGCSHICDNGTQQGV